MFRDYDDSYDTRNLSWIEWSCVNKCLIKSAQNLKDRKMSMNLGGTRTEKALKGPCRSW